MNENLYQINDANENIVSVYPLEETAISRMKKGDTLEVFERVIPEIKKIGLSCAVGINMDFFFYHKNKDFGVVGSLTKIVPGQEYKYIHNDKVSYTHCEFRTDQIYTTLNNFALPNGLLLKLYLKNGTTFKTEEYSFKNDIFNWKDEPNTNETSVIGFKVLGLARGYSY